ncbi:hypothetical protein [Butyrivibrio sp. FCS014]|nr:hypothetical protein [Butyrivibrio sp. FCS014]
MVTEDILPFIDENYRTVKDARFRFTVGGFHGRQRLLQYRPEKS